MTANELIKLIPQKTFQDLAVETNVDCQVKKLSGEIIFKLILFSMLNSEKLSLRVMESYLHSFHFKSFTNYDIVDGKYNSIRDRICTINAEYFEKIFHVIFSIYNKELREEKAISKTDSTYVSIAAKLFSTGIAMGDDINRFVKYTVSMKGSLPSSVKIFTEQEYINDQVTLAQMIDDSNNLKNEIIVFDRGLQSRPAFDRFTDDGKLFITRGVLNAKCKPVDQIPVAPKPSDSTVTITSDTVGYLTTKVGKKTTHVYRLIKGQIDNSEQQICFITNILDEDAYTIAKWYKKRWEIEVFFKFIKQHLNVKHLVSRDVNAIKVMIYMTMILATLIIAYKKLNKLKGYKLAKLKFEIELDAEIVKNIVLICGGDPNKAPHFFNTT